MNKRKRIVLKFGSSVLLSEDDLPSAVHEIYRWWREGAQVIAVVSAFGDTTDQLMRRAERVCDNPDESILPSLLATGEATAAALLTLALRRAGIPARLVDEVQAKLRTVGGGIDAEPIAVDTARLLKESSSAVVVLPGFVGRDEGGDRTLLGRGGSDLTALFLAQQLKADCVLIKDVDGLYTSDPTCTTVRPSRFAQVSYESAIRLGGGVVQVKAIRFAAANKLRFSITSIGGQADTEVGPFADRLDSPASSTEPLKVALLGCGTVGGGVFAWLTAMPEFFSVTGVGTRTAVRAIEAGVPPELITPNLEELVEKPCDVVVELIGGNTRAASLIEQSLKLRRHVISANKALLAHSVERFEMLAEENGTSLRYSAAVGGALPALETLRQTRAHGALQGFSGVVNGTCNFILDQLSTGSTFADAVRLAQEKGYAEAEPEFDLAGLDAAQKLILLARAAFNTTIRLESIHRKGIHGFNAETMRQAHARGKTIRLVVECRKQAGQIEASVRPVELSLNDPLAQVGGAENRLIVCPELGERLVVSGTGAGRWPTTEAIMGDLFEIRRQRVAEQYKEWETRVA